jgi:para-aminobenzoate synthetase component 1
LRLAVYPHGRQSPLADHKTTNYMLQRNAAIWAKERGADEAIILNADGSVSETNTANLLCRIAGKWVQPASVHVLPGTMEKALLELLDDWGETVTIRSMSVENLKAAESVLVTNALIGVVSVIEIDGAPVKPDVELCRRINEVLLG